MNKELMISIQPQHAINILNGKKTLELRTWIPKGYVGWVYVYIAKKKPYISHICEVRVGVDEVCYYETFDIPHFGDVDLNGKVAFRFWFDEYEEVLVQHHIDSEQIERVIKQACIEHDDLDNYVGNRETIYAWHIKHLEIFDKPMELKNFHKLSVGKETSAYIRLDKAPQSWQYVYVKGESK